MKGYKFVVPVFIIVLYAASIYMLYSQREKLENEYMASLEAARIYRKQEIIVDAEVNYMQALELKPSVELYIEIGEMYLETGQKQKLEDWEEELIDRYPDKIEGYEFLIKIYMEKKDYGTCFGIYDTVNSRKLKSSYIDEQINEIRYEYYMSSEYEEVKAYNEDMCIVRNNDKWGYVNTMGGRCTELNYIKAGPFSGGLAPVVDVKGDAYYIDTAGNKKFVLTNVENVCEHTNAENNVLGVYNGESWGFYNPNGKLLFGEYDNVSSISYGVIGVEKEGFWNIIDTEGNLLSEEKYYEIAMDENNMVYKNDRLFVRTSEKYVMTDKAGNKINEQEFEAVDVFRDNTWAAVKIGEKWGFTDKNGNIKIEPVYENARSFSNGMAAVMLEGKWGFINMDNELVIEPAFDASKDFNTNGCVYVFNGTKEIWQMLILYSYHH